MEEIWKDIEGYDREYQVSNLGNVRSLNYKNTGKCKNLKFGKSKDGYFIVCLRKRHKGCTVGVHKLVGLYFVEGYFEGAEIDHIDTNITNNIWTNLRWVTHKENCNNPKTRQTHSKREPRNHGKITPDEVKKKISENHADFSGGNHPKAKAVYCLELNKSYPTAKQASIETGINRLSIGYCCRKERKTAGGYHWMYYEDWLKINNK